MPVPIPSDADRRTDRRRVVALACGIAPVGPHAAAIEVSQAARAREPLHAVALAVVAIHAAITVALWHAWVPAAHPTPPRPLAVEVDASESARIAEPGERRRTDGAIPVPPVHGPSPGLRETVMHREIQPNLAAPRRIDHASSSRQPPAAAAVAQPDGEFQRTGPVREPAAPAAAHASADTMPPIAPSSTESEPVTAPRFAAAYLRNPAPDYPDVAQRRGWEGTTILNVHVLANGRPDQVLLSASSGHDALDDAAVAAVTDWRFVPAKRGTASIDGWVRVPVVFKLGN